MLRQKVLTPLLPADSTQLLAASNPFLHLSVFEDNISAKERDYWVEDGF
jgi:hypothetical protein